MCTCTEATKTIGELCAACKEEWAEWIESDLRQARSAQPYGLTESEAA